MNKLLNNLCEIGIFVYEDKRIGFLCTKCNKVFDDVETMNHLEKVYGIKGWQPEWVKLREARYFWKRSMKKGKTIVTERPVKL